MIKVSIVVPVYNSRDFILKALDSIPKRKDVQLIIVDDCSTDGSFEICKDGIISNNDDFGSTYLFQNDQNMGVGFSKNFAYDLAEGEYVVTVDSDDWCNTDDYNKAIDALYNLDYDRIMFAAQYNDGHISDGTIRTATGGQFLKKDFLVKNDLTFDSSHRRAEDGFLMIKISKINHTEAKLSGIVPYHYNDNREGSLTWWGNKNGRKD